VEALWLPASEERVGRPAVQGPLLVDGSEDEVLQGALRVAHLLAKRDGVTVRVRFGGPAPASRVETLAGAARSDGAAYLLSGLPPVGTRQRQARARMASSLAVEAATPVLAVLPGVERLPRSVLAAVDGTGASLDAARAAIPLVGERGSFTLLHVAESPTAMEPLRDFAQEIVERSDLAVHLVVVQGEPHSVLAEWAAEFDLVTLGVSGHESFDPAPASSALAAAFQHARGAVLVAHESGCLCLGAGYIAGESRGSRLHSPNMEALSR
jgi:hypothetical protein